MVETKASSNQNASIKIKKIDQLGGGQAHCLLLSTAGSITVKEVLHTSHNSILLTGAEYPYCCSFSHHTVVEIAAKIHDSSMQFPQYNCSVLYPTVSSLYETEDISRISRRGICSSVGLITAGAPKNHRKNAPLGNPALKRSA
jgi:hypothetical protein